MPKSISTEKYPVDVCYMVADLKYNLRQGVKICEVQQSSLSAFSGDTYRNATEESIHQELLRCLSKLNKNGWVVTEGMADKKMINTLNTSAGWKNPKDLIGLFSGQEFMERSKIPPSDIHDLSTYQGFLYASWSQLSVINDFEDRLPGMVIMDKSSFPFWIDKQRMTELFNQDAYLAKIKPKWGTYEKIYTKKLADTIAQDLGCDIFVIKPRGNFMGKGVIIVGQQDLDQVLHYIITKKGELAKSKDPAYRAWQKDIFDSFIVEEFVSSDHIKIAHLGNKMYQPTMRVAFLLIYNKGRHSVEFLGSYWKTPAGSVHEEGDFMYKNKDICKPPYYCPVAPNTLKSVYDQLRSTLPTLHKKMLQFSPAQGEEWYKPTNKQLQIMLKEVQIKIDPAAISEV